MRRWFAALAAGGLACCLSACSQQLSWPDQTNLGAPGAAPIPLNTTTRIGQTFLALEAGLDGADIYLAPDSPTQGDIQLELLPAPQTPNAGQVLASASLPAGAVSAPGFYHFAFAAQPDSRQHSYYLRLNYAGPGGLQVGHGPPDAYLQGALYRNDGPDDGAQMAFRLAYDPAWVTAGVLSQAVTWAGWLLAAALLFVVPGWALLVWLWPGLAELGWAEQAGLAIGLSVALYPILFLWTYVIGLQLAWAYAVLPPGLGLAALGVWLARRWRLSPPIFSWPTFKWSPSAAPDLALLAVTALIVFIRFWAVRALPAPMWGDSYQHTLITQLILDHGGLFSSWAPYAELNTFTYHFGFHTLAAVFHWLTGLSAAAAVLWMGQILNILAALAVYPLAVRITGQRWAGVGAVLVAGLLSPTPMVYTDWGRYTQLAGQVVLPAAVTLAWVVLDGERFNRRALALAGLAMGGLALSHYRILIFAVIFFAAYAMLNFGQFRRAWPRFVGMGLIGGAIFLPWFIRVFGGQVLRIFAVQISTLPATTAAVDSNSFGSLDLYANWLWLAAAMTLAVGLWRRERRLALLGLWCFLVVLAANPEWLRLPGQGALTNFAVIVIAYLPLGVVLGAAAGWVAAAGGAAGRWQRLAPGGLLALALVAGALGARQRLADLAPQQYGLVTWADVRAADWIQSNTPADARFLVNAFLAYNGTAVVGADAGWWLPALARRATILPPLNYGFEMSDRPNYRDWVMALPVAIQSKGVADGAVAQLLADHGVTYVYLGQQRGSVNNPGAPLLDAGALVAGPGFRLVYHQDRVFIFQVVR